MIATYYLVAVTKLRFMEIEKLITKVNNKNRLDSNLKNIRHEGIRDLFEQWKVTKAWLESHTAETNTNNSMDINGRDYSAKEFEEKLHLYEQLENELIKRCSTREIFENTLMRYN